MQTEAVTAGHALRPHRHIAAATAIAGSVLMATIFLCGSNVLAHEMTPDMAHGMHHRQSAAAMQENSMALTTGTAVAPAPALFIASTAKPFSELMDDAMAVMDYGMAHAPMNGQPEHDFVTMMMPHHQGAVDMAKAMLLYTDDPEIRNLALGIITEQQNEIRVMQAWLQRHDGKNEKSGKEGK